MKLFLLRFQMMALLLCFFCSSAIAGDGTGKIVQLMAHSSNIVIFILDGGHTAKPACSSDAWALSLSTNGGRAMYALLLSAQSQGKSVHVHGTGACGAWADREEPVYIFMQ